MNPTDVRCYTCDAEPGAPCRSHATGEVLTVVHYNRASAAWTAARRDTEPCPAPGRLEQIQDGDRGDSGRPICACGQTIWRAGDGECADCTQMRWTSGDHDDPVSLDARIREAQTPDRIHCAWSTPTSDGEGWR